MTTKDKLFIILSMALAVRLTLIIIFKTYIHPVTWEYEVIVNNLLSGKGFLFYFFDVPYRSLNAPLYSFLCAGIYILTNHSYLAVLLAQSLFTMFLALVIFKIAKIIFDEKVAFMSAIIVSFHPGFIYYDVFNLIPLSIDSFLIATAALLVLKFKDRPSILNISLLGMMVGLGALSRGIIWALIPFLSLYFILFITRLALHEKFKIIIFFAIAAFIVITPWIIRNYVIHKRFIFIVSTTGENLWRGNNKYAVGTSFNKEGKTIIELWPEEFRKKVFALDEIGQKNFFEKEAMYFIRKDPLGFIKRYITKIYYFWWFSPQSGIIYPKPYFIIYRYLYSILLGFSILGLILSLASGEKVIKGSVWLIIFIFMAIFLTQSLFYVEGRHRWLVEPLLIIFFSYGINESYELLLRKIKLLSI